MKIFTIGLILAAFASYSAVRKREDGILLFVHSAAKGLT
jgi:hypothetical protein